MSRSQYYDVVGHTDSVSGAFKLVTTTRITVYVAPPYAATPLTTLASIYSAETGATTPGNPFLATTGESTFWAAPGSYDIKIEDTAASPAFTTRYVRWDAAPADKGVLSTMLEVIAAQSLMPVGAMVPYAGLVAPTGFLVCDGSLESSSAYPQLDALIGAGASPAHVYNGGTSPGAGLFKLPDKRGRGSIGAGTGTGLTARTRGTRLGEETHLLIVSEMPAHTHRLLLSSGVTTGAPSYDRPESGNAADTANWNSNGVESTGGGGPHNNMQPVEVDTWIIRAL